MHSDPDRISRSRTESCAARQCSRGGSYAEPENSPWSVAGFYGTARPSAVSGNDARRRTVDLEDTFETATRAAGADLSSISRLGWRDSDHNLHHVHGTATDRIHVGNRRCAAIAHAHPTAHSSCNHAILVGRGAARDCCCYWVPRVCPH